MGYGIEARDGSVGEVSDLVLDERTRAIREVVVNTRSWCRGGRVRVHPAFVERIEGLRRKIRLRLTRDQVKGAVRAMPGG